ncbi:hypothetical protein AVEN_80002-1 [Araneus ventricosus]|uniref:Uncharacterized protein n=1 Tax=Araneus ventricosus TaxID=182803 RepID=A0A4Y2FLY4_ARAVE|nr:hypothetical protein AVEN_80002-1 [Araneus ventricosus]
MRCLPVVDLAGGREQRSCNVDVSVKEKEEHLLPPPYQTNCRDNGPSADAEMFTNPNSYQVCLEMCRSQFSKEMYGCDYGMTMLLSRNHLCYGKRITDANPARYENLEHKCRKKEKDYEKTLRKEMTACENEGVRGKYLSSIHEYLLTIKPTSVEAERAF